MRGKRMKFSDRAREDLINYVRYPNLRVRVCQSVRAYYIRYIIKVITIFPSRSFLFFSKYYDFYCYTYYKRYNIVEFNFVELFIFFPFRLNIHDTCNVGFGFRVHPYRLLPSTECRFLVLSSLDSCVINNCYAYIECLQHIVLTR